MIAINDKGRCCGCGACAQACPTHCIEMRQDQEGFLYPMADATRCVDCGKCEQVCPIIRADSPLPDPGTAFEQPLAIGGRHRDEAIRQASSSGGAFSLFADRVFAMGGVVYGAAMRDGRVVHVCATNAAELAALRGSKYVQSVIGDAYSEIEGHLKAGRPVLFTGTPCQTAGLASFLGKPWDNLYLVDFICHGTPSPKIFAEYLASIEAREGSKVVSFSFREKDKGWHESGLQMGTRAKLANGKEIRKYPALRDSYMNGFLEDIYLRPSCYQCRFKVIPKHTADITIADFWGVNRVLPQLNDGRGTSLLLIHNERGKALFDAVSEAFEYQECDWKAATVKNPTLIRPASVPDKRETFFGELEARGYDYVARKYLSTPRTVVSKGSRIIGGKLEKLIQFGVGVTMKVLPVEKTQATRDRLTQFYKFCMVGVSNVAFSYTVNVVSLLLINLVKPGLKYDYIIANTIAFLLSVYWSFFWNSRKVFHLKTRTKAERWKALLRSYLCYGFTGILLNNLLSTLWIEVLGISKYLSPLLNLVFTIPLNYLTNKKWAFAVKDESDGAD
jgi:coenzyme F420-reducing hydrogenase beta subunit/putative flippase GtrA